MLVAKVKKILVFVLLLGMSKEKNPPPIIARKGRFVIVGKKKKSRTICRL
jgi:hypothetical protein